ncbi:MAG TPA: PD-(D/E)XK nuclease family protein [Dehalococcoidia bacterium]|nr:PD-(D/E)XK nuclease family protein [Dehalococcoidia bacterium]
MAFDAGAEPAAGDEAADRRALEALVIDNPDLEWLEVLLDEFNIFEAAGWTRQEARHSDFLAFLLDPRQTHGLGDTFVKRFLQRVLQGAGGAQLPISPIELDLWSLDGLLVLREWQRIDILLLDETHKLAVIIENKIDSGEHDDQLDRYWKAIAAQHPGWTQLGIYLTPDGAAPKHRAYLPGDYALVINLIEALLESRAASLGADVQTSLRHYTRMLRRYIVNDSEIGDLCRRIYQKHRRALELIIQYRPSLESRPLTIISDLIEQSSDLLRLQVRTNTVSFAPLEWDIPELRTGTSPLPSLPT